MIFRDKIERIYNSYVNDLYNYAIYLGSDKDVAMDAIHDVFCKMCTNENIDSIQDIKFYLLRALKNRLLNIYQSKHFNFHALNDFSNTIDQHTDLEELYISKEEETQIKQKINELLSMLSGRQREIIYLRYIQEYDYEQIAQIMQISYGSCRKLMHSAITKLRKHYPYVLALIAFLKEMSDTIGLSDFK